MIELKKLFDDAIDKWHTSDSNEALHAWLQMSFCEYRSVVETPDNLFYVFYNNENFQDVILNLLENSN